jgi:hypothetical protein
MPIYRVEIDQPLVGPPIECESLPCWVSGADPGHAIRLLRSNIHLAPATQTDGEIVTALPIGIVPLKAVESEMQEGTAVDWQTMLCTPEAYTEWQALEQTKKEGTEK